MSLVAPVPALYKGERFRTVLEAQWAAFFDLVEWTWEYEPLTHRGWTPTFEVTFACAHSECGGSHTLLATVKPVSRIDDFGDHQCMLYNYGYWQGDSIPADASAAFGNHPSVSRWEMSHGAGGGEECVREWVKGDIDALWREAAKRVSHADSSKPKNGKVYFIEATGAALVKIGHTEREVQERLKELQTGCPHRLQIIATMAGDQKAESDLHAQFAALKVSGEWFRLEDDLRAYISFVRWVLPRLEEFDCKLNRLGGEVRLLFQTLHPLERAGEAIARNFQALSYALTPLAGDTRDEITDTVRRQVLGEFSSVEQIQEFMASQRGRH